MGGGSSKNNVQLTLDDIHFLRNAFQDSVGDDERVRQLTQVAAAYIVVNRALIECAFEAWRSTPEERLLEMHKSDITLDGSATVHSFDSIGGHLIPLAKNIVIQDNAGPIEVSDDDLHMMMRVLEYAQHLTDCSTTRVRWHPVEQWLGLRANEVDELRATLVAR